MGCSMSRDINRGLMVKRGRVVKHKCTGTESSKISTFHPQQKKYLRAIHFQIHDTTALLYPEKMGEQGIKCY